MKNISLHVKATKIRLIALNKQNVKCGIRKYSVYAHILCCLLCL